LLESDIAIILVS